MLTELANQRLDLTAATRLLGPRKLLREGKVEKAKSHRSLNVYLFNDLLIFTESKPGGAGEAVYRLVSRFHLFTSSVFLEADFAWSQCPADSPRRIISPRKSSRRTFIHRDLPRRVDQRQSRKCPGGSRVDERHRSCEEDLLERGQQIAENEDRLEIVTIYPVSSIPCST
jgi:hypothetical protein